MSRELLRIAVACVAVATASQVLAAATTGSCAGPAAERREALVEASDSRIAVSIDAVIVPNGSGSWEDHARWDEYCLRVRSVSSRGLRLLRLSLFDAMGKEIEPGSDPDALSSATHEILRRYGASGLLAQATAPDGRRYIAVPGASSAALGISLAPAGPRGFILPWNPVGAVLSIAHAMAWHTMTAAEIERRQTRLPAQLLTTDSALVVFFPMVPLPGALELVYVDEGEERRLRIDTAVAMSQAHLADLRPLPSFPLEAARKGIDRGQVKAVLLVDANGDVTDVEITESSLPMFVEDAREAFRGYKYRPGRPGRKVEVMSFNRAPKR